MTHDIVERLRMNAEMLKDGYQKNLTELWHSDVVRDAAKDATEAAGEIERLRAAAQAPMREALADAIEMLESYSFSRGIDPRKATPESVIGRGRAALAQQEDSVTRPERRPFNSSLPEGDPDRYEPPVTSQERKPHE